MPSEADPIGGDPRCPVGSENSIKGAWNVWDHPGFETVDGVVVAMFIFTAAVLMHPLF